MLRFVKTMMQLCALMVYGAIGVALRALMPNVQLGTAVFLFLVLVLVFLFACTLAVASLLIGSAPSRSKFGQRLADKVSRDAAAAEDMYGHKCNAAREASKASAEAAMPGEGDVSRRQ